MPQAKVWLNGEFCKTLINTEAEINVMIKKIQERLNLPIQLDSTLRLISHSEHKQNFIGIYEDINITIGDITTQQHIFIVDSANHILIFGIPFMIKTRARMDWNVNDYMIITCYSSDDFWIAISKILDWYPSSGLIKQDFFPSNSLNSHTVIMPGWWLRLELKIWINQQRTYIWRKNAHAKQGKLQTILHTMTHYLHKRNMKTFSTNRHFKWEVCLNQQEKRFPCHNVSFWIIHSHHR